MKLDIVDDNCREVDQHHAEKFAMHLNGNRFKEDTNKDFQKPYFETSSVTGQNVDEVFEFIFSTLLPTDKDDASVHRSSSQHRGGHIRIDDDGILDQSQTSKKSKNCCK